MTADPETFLLQGEQGLRNIMQQAPVAMAIVLGPEFQIYLANERQLQLWQKESSQVLGKPLFSVFPEVEAQGFREKLTEVYTSGVAFRGEEVPARFSRNGVVEAAWFDFIYEPLRNDLDQVEGIMVISTEVTDKVIARLNLEEKKEQLYYTVKLHPQVHWTTNAAGEMEFIDEKWLDYTGMQPQEVLQKGWHLITHPDDRELLAREWQHSLDTGNPCNVAHRVRMSDNTYRWMRSRAFPRITPDGRIVRWHGSTEDIQEMREATELLEQSEEKYRSLFERMNQGFCIVEVIFDDTNTAIDYRFLECNARFQEQTGLVDALGKTARQLLPNLEAHWFRNYGNVALTGVPFSFIEGSEVMGRWFEVNAYRLGDEHSRKVAILFADITERKRGEEVLRKVTENQQSTLSLLQSLLENAPVGFAFTDKENRYTHINELLAEINGLPAADHLGKHIEEVLPGVGARIVECLNHVKQTQQPLFNIELQGTTPRQPGVLRHWLAGYYPVFGVHSGEVEQVGAVITEITTQKQAEQKIAESEKRYHNIYNRAPVSIWEEDFTAVREHVLQLKAQGVTDMVAYFQHHPEMLTQLLGQIVIKDVNQATLDIYGGSREQLLAGLHHFFIPQTLLTLAEELQVIADGGGRYEAETTVQTNNGTLVDVLVRIDFPFEDDYTNVHVILFDITERKTAEYAIRESEERFRNLADNAPVMIWITDKDGYCHYLNKQWYDFTGQSIEEGKGIGWTNAVHPEESAMAAQVFLESSNNHVPYRIEFRLRKWDGTYRWVIDSAVPRLDAEGHFMGYIGSVVDIHDKKVAEEQLKKLNSHMELATQSAGVGTWSYELRAGTLEWSELHQRLWGYDPTTSLLNYEDWYKVIVPEDRAGALEQVEAAMRANIDYVNEYRIQRADSGEERWMRSFGRFLTDATNTPVVLTGITIDITEAKAVEAALRESEARFRSLADNAPMWVWLADDQGNITYANREELDFFGVQDLRLISGKNWEELIHPEDLEAVYGKFNSAVTERKPYSLEARLRNRNTGQYEWFHFRGVPRVEAGVFNGMIGTAINVHAQKLFTEELERMVKERTRELERSNNDLRQFAHVASHDLKEPVRKVMTFHNRLMNEFGSSLPERAVAYLGRIEKAAKRSKDMIDGLLWLTAIDSAADPVQPIDFNQMVAELEEDLELVIREQAATIYYRQLPEVEGIYVLLYHMCYNIVMNALKFGRRGVPVHLAISAESFQRNGQPFTRMIFQDNGIGFDQSFCEQIFQPFKRLHSKDEFEGAGLGLSFCRQVAERHGGTIAATGIEGVGAIFILEMPLYQAGWGVGGAGR